MHLKMQKSRRTRKIVRGIPIINSTLVFSIKYFTGGMSNIMALIFSLGMAFSSKISLIAKRKNSTLTGCVHLKA
jgi:hypothetical protein